MNAKHLRWLSCAAVLLAAGCTRGPGKQAHGAMAHGAMAGGDSGGMMGDHAACAHEGGEHKSGKGCSCAHGDDAKHHVQP